MDFTQIPSIINQLLPDYDFCFDSHKELFQTIVSMTRAFLKKGCFQESFRDNEIKTGFESSKKCL